MPVREGEHPALARCIRTAVATFAAEYWDHRPLLSPAAELPGGLTDLLTLDDVDELLSRRGLRTPFLRVAKDGEVVPSSRFTGPGGTGAGVGDQVDDAAVLELFAGGSTVVLQGLHRLWPPIIDFAGQLAADLGHPVQVNAYVTPPQSQGFRPHYDTHDVFVLQTAGEKHWTIHEPVVPRPAPTQPWTDHRKAVEEAARGEPVVDAVLRPGDALYLPRGYLHSARALGGTTVHLTVGVHPVTRWSVLEALLPQLQQDPSLRASLPLGLDPADETAVAAATAETLEALRTALGSVRGDAVGDALHRQLAEATRPAPIAPLAQARAAADLAPGEAVRARPHLRWRLETGAGGSPVLVLRRRRVPLPAGSDKAVLALLDGDVHRVGDLPGLDAERQVSLVRDLLEAAVVVPAAG